MGPKDLRDQNSHGRVELETSQRVAVSSSKRLQTAGVREGGGGLQSSGW